MGTSHAQQLSSATNVSTKETSHSARPSPLEERFADTRKGKDNESPAQTNSVRAAGVKGAQLMTLVLASISAVTPDGSEQNSTSLVCKRARSVTEKKNDDEGEGGRQAAPRSDETKTKSTEVTKDGSEARMSASVRRDECHAWSLFLPSSGHRDLKCSLHTHSVSPMRAIRFWRRGERGAGTTPLVVRGGVGAARTGQRPHCTNVSHSHANEESQQ